MKVSKKTKSVPKESSAKEIVEPATVFKKVTRDIAPTPIAIPSSNIKKLQTHYYDGKLKNQISSLRLPYTKSEKVKKFTQLKEAINHTKQRTHLSNAMRAITMIAVGVETDANYDKTNDVYADEILYIISENLQKDMIDDLVIQLADITTHGACPQGRCTRLAQLYFAMFQK